MKLIIFSLLLLFSFPNIIFAENIKTLECSDWNLYSVHGEEAKIFKVFFVRGIYEGLVLGESPNSNQYSNSYNYDDLVKEIDSYCQDSANENLGIFNIILVVSLRNQGKDDELINTILKLTRKSGNFLLRDFSNVRN